MGCSPWTCVNTTDWCVQEDSCWSLYIAHQELWEALQTSSIMSLTFLGVSLRKFHFGPRKAQQCNHKELTSNQPYHHTRQIYYWEHPDQLYQSLLCKFPTSEYKSLQQTVKMTENTIRVFLPCIHDIYHKSYICKDSIICGWPISPISQAL